REAPLGDAPVERQLAPVCRGSSRSPALGVSPLLARAPVDAGTSLWPARHLVQTSPPREILAHAPIECAELLVDAALRSPALELVARPEVDEACVTGKPRMDFLDAPEHLLRHPSIVGVALGRGAQ